MPVVLEGMNHLGRWIEAFQLLFFAVKLVAFVRC